MEEYAIYLRKSRKDDDYAGTVPQTDGDVLRRHERMLTELASKMKLSVTEIYREVVSGESIAARPAMKQLLDAVSGGRFAGVLVIEVERLARGDTSDQGTVAKTFAWTHTKIITPSKIYDPDNEFDEEYFEFGLFMSRREYKTINRRLTRGRKASVSEGKWIFNKQPFGYRRVKLENQKGYRLEPDENAETVKEIFAMYAAGKGSSVVARTLNERGIMNSKGKPWSPESILEIIKNIVYLGKVKYGSRPQTMSMENGEKKVSTPRAKEYLIADGLHEALIDEDTWQKCQFHLMDNRRIPVPQNKELANPLSGLIRCSVCGRALSRVYDSRKQRAILQCGTFDCPTRASYLDVVEESLLQSLDGLVNEKAGAIPATGADELRRELNDMKKRRVALETRLTALDKQRDSLYDLLEQGVYTADVFTARQRKIAEQIHELEQEILSLDNIARQKEESLGNIETLIPRIRAALSVYRTLPSPAEKNSILKDFLSYASYTKTVSGTKFHPAPFTLDLFLKS